MPMNQSFILPAPQSPAQALGQFALVIAQPGLHQQGPFGIKQVLWTSGFLWFSTLLDNK